MQKPLYTKTSIALHKKRGKSAAKDTVQFSDFSK